MSECKQSRDISEDKESTNNCDITKPHETKHCSITFQIQTAKNNNEYVSRLIVNKQSEMSTVQPLFGSHVTKRIEILKPQQSMKEICEGSTHNSGECGLSIFLVAFPTL